MKLYKKPVITLDSGMAEGVYAASGATDFSNSNRVSLLRYDGDWGNSGIAVYTLDLSGLNLNQLTVVLTFNIPIASGWGGGANTHVDGNTLTLSWWNANTETLEISVKVENADVKQLECTSFSYSNN